MPEIHGNTASTVAGVPTGTGVTKQWYGYTNKRKRLDFDDGTSKIYDYKTLVDPGNERKPAFPSPQGFKCRTDNIASTCCWLWLVDDNEDPDRMEKLEVEHKAKDVGADPRGEHWSSVIKFPFLQTDDWFFRNDGNDTLSATNSYVKIPGKTSESGYVMSNSNVRQRPVRPHRRHRLRAPRLTPDLWQVQAVRRGLRVPDVNVHAIIFRDKTYGCVLSAKRERLELQRSGRGADQIHVDHCNADGSKISATATHKRRCAPPC